MAQMVFRAEQAVPAEAESPPPELTPIELESLGEWRPMTREEVVAFGGRMTPKIRRWRREQRRTARWLVARRARCGARARRSHRRTAPDVSASGDESDGGEPPPPAPAAAVLGGAGVAELLPPTPSASSPLASGTWSQTDLDSARQPLGADAADVELENVLEFRRLFAIAMLRGCREEAARGTGAVRSLADARRLVPDEHREEVEERAAIREFDGGLERDEAEIGAVMDFLNGRRRART